MHDQHYVCVKTPTDRCMHATPEHSHHSVCMCVCVQAPTDRHLNTNSTMCPNAHWHMHKHNTLNTHITVCQTPIDRCMNTTPQHLQCCVYVSKHPDKCMSTTQHPQHCVCPSTHWQVWDTWHQTHSTLFYASLSLSNIHSIVCVQAPTDKCEMHDTNTQHFVLCVTVSPTPTSLCV